MNKQDALFSINLFL